VKVACFLAVWFGTLHNHSCKLQFSPPSSNIAEVGTQSRSKYAPSVPHARCDKGDSGHGDKSLPAIYGLHGRCPCGFMELSR
jgi:hypothetical protein